MVVKRKACDMWATSNPQKGPEDKIFSQGGDGIWNINKSSQGNLFLLIENI